MMSRHAENFGHLEGSSLRDSRLRRALAARFDSAFKGAGAGVGSAHAAKWLAVSEDGVQYWRCGITIPPLNACTRLATFLDLDVH